MPSDVERHKDGTDDKQHKHDPLGRYIGPKSQEKSANFGDALLVEWVCYSPTSLVTASRHRSKRMTLLVRDEAKLAQIAVSLFLLGSNSID